jgi:uncharacterized membrane protein YphA (DoxX/SURF4 family)
VTRWLERWNAYWFPTTTTVHLAVCRIVAVAAQLFWFRPPLEEQIRLVESNRTFIDPQVLIRAIAAVVPRHVLFTPAGLTVLYWVTALAGLMALIGFFTRTSLLVFALGTWFFVAHRYSYADIHHPEAVFCIFLLALAFAPSGASLSIDALLRRQRAAGQTVTAFADSDMAMWPLKLGQVLMALTYFSTGLTKVVFGGLDWINGYTLQGYLLQDGLRRNLPLGLWVAQHHTLCVLLSIFTVVFELSFFVSLIVPRTAPFFLLNALLFQLGLLVTAGHEFYPHMTVLLLLLVFVEPAWWRVLGKKYFGVPTAAISRLLGVETT